MQRFVRLILATANLVEAEGRVARKQVMRTANAGALTFTVVVLCLTGLSLFLTSLLLALWPTLGGPLACLIVGALAMLLALGLLEVKRRWFRNDENQT